VSPLHLFRANAACCQLGFHARLDNGCLINSTKILLKSILHLFDSVLPSILFISDCRKHIPVEENMFWFGQFLLKPGYYSYLKKKAANHPLPCFLSPCKYISHFC